MKGYPGPELPAELVALVKYDTRGSDMDIEHAVINGIPFRSSGITVLAGQQSYELQVELNGEVGQCDAYANFDSSGFHKCQKKESYCDCYSYLTVYDRCQKRVREATCRGTLETAIGRTYIVMAEGDWNDLNTVVGEVGKSFENRKSACVMGGEHFEETNDYLGSGSSYSYRLDGWEDPCRW